MGIARGPKIVTSGLVLALDAADKNSYDGNIVVYSVQCYSTYSVSLRSSNYTVQYSDDNSNWTTAFTGVMSNNSSCGIITGTGVNTSNLTAHKYWRYVEGSAVTLHHPRVSRIDFITPNGSVYNLITYTSDNCADSGTVAVGTVSKQFTPSNWRDLSGNNNTGTLTNGPTFSTANMGSIVFDGVDDYVIDDPTINMPLGSSSRTICVWAYLNNYSSNVFIHIGTNSSGQKYIFQVYTSDFVYIFTDGVNNNNNVTITDAQRPTLNVWNHLTFKNEGQNYEYFLNGISQKTGTFSTTLNTVTQRYLIGKRDDVATGTLNGRIATLSVYNRALSATEVLQNYNATKSRFGL